MKEKGAKFLPHTAGRYAVKRFRKAQVCRENLCFAGKRLREIFSVPLWSD